MGFGVPIGTWFRSSLTSYLKDNLLARDACYTAFLSRRRVEALIETHLSGHSDLGLQLWSLLTFERWLRLLPEWTRDRAAVATN
jgi:asparagine synthase (glutamine-hydrolysing)